MRSATISVLALEPTSTVAQEIHMSITPYPPTRPTRIGGRRGTTFAVAAAVVTAIGACSDAPTAASTASAASPSASAGAPGGATPSNYTVVDLGTLGGPFSIAFDVNNVGQAVGSALTSDGLQH